MIDNSIEISSDDLQRGDLLRKSGHSILYVSGTYPASCNVYESQADNETPGHPSYPGVCFGWIRDFRNYTPRSIFPQFSDEQPENGIVLEDSQTVNISLTIKASGDIVSNGSKMFIREPDGVEKYIGDAVLNQQSNHEWILSKSDFNVEEGGQYSVRVIARNDIANNGYVDEYSWWFIVNQDSTPPVVTLTHPEGGEANIPVNFSPISITFSREMDKIVTQDAISIISEGGNFVPFTSTWDGNKTLKIKPSVVLDYYKRYLVLITDEAKDTSGVKLDGDKDIFFKKSPFF